jgi:ABC-type cobalamin transport system permease subunit
LERKLAIKPSKSDTTPIRIWSWQLVVALGVLIGIWTLSSVENTLAKSIFPYALSVGLIAEKNGLLAGFCFAAVATLVALASGAFPTHPTSAGHEAVEGLITYAQLSVVCLIVYFVRRRPKRSGD